MSNVLKLRGKKAEVGLRKRERFLQDLATSGAQFIPRNSASVLRHYSPCLSGFPFCHATSLPEAVVPNVNPQ
jgi:hypothetical protein